MEQIPASYLMELIVGNNYEALETLLDTHGEDFFYELGYMAQLTAALPNVDPKICELLAYWLIPQTDLWSFADFIFYAFYGYDHMTNTKNDELKSNILTYGVIPIYLEEDEDDEENAGEELLAKIISSIEKLELEQLIGLILWIRTYIEHGYLDCAITECLLKRCVDLKVFNPRETLLFMSISKNLTLWLESLIEDDFIGLI